MNDTVNNTAAVKSVDLVNVWVKNVNGAEYGFFGAVMYALQQAEQFNNWNPLSKMVILSGGRKGKKFSNIEKDRMPYAMPLKTILDHVLVNVSYIFDADKDYGMVWKREDGWSLNAAKMADLQKCADEKMRITYAAFKEAFPRLVKERTEKVLTEDERKVANAKKLDALSARIAKLVNESGLDCDLVFGEARKSVNPTIKREPLAASGPRAVKEAA